MDYTILSCTVFVFGIILIRMEGEQFRVNNLLTVSRHMQAASFRSEMQSRDSLRMIEAEMGELIERDARQFDAVTNSLLYDVDITPSMETPYVEVMASLPRLHFRFDRRELAHKGSLEIIAREGAQRLSELSYDTIIRFLMADMKIGRIIQ